ncbi:MAG: hypothetical protein ACTSQJ_02760 [Promethearchaeota archaeon]
MLYVEMTTSRVIQVFVVQLGMGIVYLLIALLILKRDRKRLNQIFSAFYLTIAAATIVNVIYVAIELNPIVSILHFITVYLFFLGPAFLLIFNLILLKSEKVIDNKKQILIIGGYSVILFITMILTATLPDQMQINEDTGWVPVWGLTFVFTLLITYTIIALIPVTITSIQVFSKFEDTQLKKKWMFFILSVFILFIYFYFVPLRNASSDETFRNMVSYLGLMLYVTAFMLYYGVGRQIQK